jgi:hypothetical protein
MFRLDGLIWPIDVMDSYFGWLLDRRVWITYPRQVSRTAWLRNTPRQKNI